MLPSSGVRRDSASKRSRSSDAPARRAIATRWMMALVDPPTATTAVTAFSKAAVDITSHGVRSSHTISTMRRPRRGSQTGVVGVGCRRGRGARQRHADCLRRRRHRGRRPHRHARAERARDAVLDLAPRAIIDRARPLLGPVLPHVAAAGQRLPPPVPRGASGRPAGRSRAGWHSRRPSTGQVPSCRSHRAGRRRLSGSRAPASSASIASRFR